MCRRNVSQSSHTDNPLSLLAHNLIRTLFWNFQPDTILVKGVLVRVETPQTAPISRVRIIVLIQRRVLMVTKHNALAGPTLSPTPPTLRALRSFLVALELTGAAGEAVGVREAVSCYSTLFTYWTQSCRDRVKAVTYQPVLERILNQNTTRCSAPFCEIRHLSLVFARSYPSKQSTSS